MTDHSELIKLNQERWFRAKPTRDFSAVARRLVSFKPRYSNVATRTGIPWFIIAVIHEREASGRWDAQLAQGDPLHEMSRHEPKGRGPFSTWEDGAYDALVRCPPYAANWRDWTPGGALTLLEMYNGLGYAMRGIPSPYIWSGTSEYIRGKFDRDHHYNPKELDMQLGCAGLIKAMRQIDPTIEFAARLDPEHVPQVTPPKQPKIKTKHASTVAAVTAAAVGAHGYGLSPLSMALIVITVGALVYFMADRWDR